MIRSLAGRCFYNTAGRTLRSPPGEERTATRHAAHYQPRGVRDIAFSRVTWRAAYPRELAIRMRRTGTIRRRNAIRRNLPRDMAAFPRAKIFHVVVVTRSKIRGYPRCARWEKREGGEDGSRHLRRKIVTWRGRGAVVRRSHKTLNEKRLFFPPPFFFPARQPSMTS